jgi:ribosomal protein S18 acetylase RimI-like enzyme
MDIRLVARLNPTERSGLARLLTAVVDEGASVGFLPPLAVDEAEVYWGALPEPATRLLVAEEDGRIVGTVQLQLAERANGRHRAEVAKLLVVPARRRRGIGRALMDRMEEVAWGEGRTLLVLDTREGDASNALYRSLGYVEVGRIPAYARSADGRLDGTVIYYKLLGG